MKHIGLGLLQSKWITGFYHRSACTSATLHAQQKPRLVVLTDIGGDPDDQMSMVRLMTYSNQIDIEGLVATEVVKTVNPGSYSANCGSLWKST